MHNPADITPNLITSAWGALLERSAEALLLVDASGQILTASAAAERLLSRGHPGLAGADALALLGLVSPAELRDGLAPPRWPGHRLRHADLGPDGALLTLVPADPPTEQASAALRREEQLREVLMAIGSALDIDTILRDVVRLTTELAGADAGSLPLYDPTRDLLRTGSMVNLDGLPEPGPTPRGVGLLWQVIDSGEPLIIEHYDEHPGALPAVIAAGYRSVVIVPVRAGQQILGAIILYARRPSGHFSARDLELLTVIGRQTGVALQNARLYQAALIEAERRHALHSASVEIGAALDAEQLYAAIHHSAARLMRCDTLIIGLLDEERREIEYVYRWDRHGRRTAARAPDHHGLLGYVVRFGVSLRIDNSDDQTRAIFGVEAFDEGETASHAILASALSIGELVIGGISVQADQPDCYGPADLSALEMLAATAAIAIQNAQLFNQIQRLATLDPLTAVPNRRHFYEVAEREVERSARYGHTLSAIMLDADHFKAINDTYGHIAGDQVLQTIAARCRGDLREVDMLARFGGEEFAVLLPETDHGQALLVARRLAARIADEPIVTDAGALSVSISLGVASSRAEQLSTVDDLLNRADQALYRAKRAGRNQVSG